MDEQKIILKKEEEITCRCGMPLEEGDEAYITDLEGTVCWDCWETRHKIKEEHE